MYSDFTGSAVELIQLALTPVFLIVGIGQMVNVVTGRLGRIIDRARWFEDLKYHNPRRIDQASMYELKSLKRRMRLANWAITFLTAAAVMICLNVVLLITNGLVEYNLDPLILTMFIIGVSFITGGLIGFFLEVSVATATLRIMPYHLSNDHDIED
ncbi:DUF2721 domain-containing protein [Aliiglaciecola sp. LCG003]|uniref:DUF2721 domain-containing protein n=1 Tax=Aliiglaciecola sp. LCG003 TaxID=3053655 RepID=UPI0025734767|nr:DUF2721 domain-containing protein [Aliiglaciecola sp. LCG003]WJG09193.1 DUF2721 domain-containing protein [Aliiglaciecola sp. LCG003]